MPRKSKKEKDILIEEFDKTDETKSGIFSQTKNNSDTLKKVAATAAISDQITLFDETVDGEVILYNSSNDLTDSQPNQEKNNEDINSTIKSSDENLKVSKSHNLKLKDETKQEETKRKKLNFLDFNRAPKKMLEIETTPEEETEKMGEAEQAVKKQNSKKKKILNLVFFLINIGIVAGILVYQLLGDTKMTSFTDLFTSGINWWIFFLIVVLSFAFLLTDAIKIWILTWKTTGKNRPILGYKVAVLGKHYDSVTPMAIGGQPFQVFYLSKNGIPASKAVSIPVGQYVIGQISSIIVSIIAMILSVFVVYSNANVGTAIVSAGSWIGFALNFLLMFVVVLVSINKKIGTGLISGCLKLLKKMHLIKEKQFENIYNKAISTVNDYQKTITSYAKSFGSFIFMLIISIGGLVIKFSMPYLVYSMFFGFNPSIYLEIFVKTVMIELASGFIPLPGGTGVAELSFTALFSALLGPNIFWGMLIWRIFTYYINMIRGIGVIIYDYARGNKKRDWLEKKWQLEDESKKFEEAQLKVFEQTLVKQNKRNKRKEKKL